MARVAFLFALGLALAGALPTPGPTGAPHLNSPSAPRSTRGCVGADEERIAALHSASAAGIMHLRGGKKAATAATVQLKQSPTLFSMTVCKLPPPCMLSCDAARTPRWPLLASAFLGFRPRLFFGGGRGVAEAAMDHTHSICQCRGTVAELQAGMQPL